MRDYLFNKEQYSASSIESLIPDIEQKTNRE